LILALVLLVFGAALYYPALKVPFLYDDTGVLLRPQTFDRPEYLRDLFSRAYFDRFGERTYRPVMTLTFFADHRLFGADPKGFHAVNIALHLLAAVCVFLLIGELGAGPPAAFAGGLIFLAHPIQTEAVALASNREELLCGLFFFLSFLFYVRGGGARFAASVLFFLLALFSKEMAASLPLVLIAYDLYSAQPRESALSALRRKFPKYIPYFLGVAALLALRYTVFGNPEGKAAWIGGSPYSTLLTMSSVFFNYIRLLIYPARQCADYAIPALHSLADAGASISLSGIIGFIVIGVYLRGRAKLAGFAAAFFFLTFLPVSNIIPFGAAMAERYLYIPSFALCLAAAALLDRPLPAYMKYIPAALAVSALAVLTANRIGVWQSDLSLWGDTVECAPQSAKAYLNLGNAYMRTNRYGKALDCYKKVPGLEGELDRGKYYYNLGLALVKTGNEKEARRAMAKSASESIRFPEPYFYLSMFAARGNDIPAAEKFLDRAVETDPQRADSRYIAGRFLIEHYKTKTKLEKAAKLLKRASELDPSSALYPSALGETYMKLGSYGEAERALKLSLRRDDKFAVSYILLTKLYNITGRRGEAGKALKTLEDIMRKSNRK
jgi:tetratricopeptide (TPR) repeat protein